MSRTNAPYTSEDLAALPKIAERLRQVSLSAEFLHESRDIRVAIEAAMINGTDALLKAHAEIVRLQGVEGRAKEQRRLWADIP